MRKLVLVFQTPLLDDHSIKLELLLCALHNLLFHSVLCNKTKDLDSAFLTDTMCSILGL
jgi:hypothetical protein